MSCPLFTTVPVAEASVTSAAPTLTGNPVAPTTWLLMASKFCPTMPKALETACVKSVFHLFCWVISVMLFALPGRRSGGFGTVEGTLDIRLLPTGQRQVRARRSHKHHGRSA